jgi:CubicO group peptidase (beta-lactamase class C family)
MINFHGDFADSTGALRVRWMLASLATIAVFAFSTFARTPQAKPKSPEPAKPPAVSATSGPETHELTAADLDTFLDGFMPEQIEHADIAGAVIAVVKDGKLLFAKGYGYADVAKKTPVSPETTLFRPGSISKLFTWTAVMQQVEQGKLDLDRDVNDYLDFKVPPAFGKPITLRDIMTHRSGFEETIKDLFVGSEKDMRPIPEYLQVHMPARIFPPGTTPAYSNYATTLAAYIVQRVSGQPFDDYVEEHIFKPLNMTHATFRQPLPDSLKASMSCGYQLGSGEAKPFEYVQVAPAGSLSASAVDMTHLMIAHLQDGRYGDAQILKPETAEEMHARQKGWPAAMNAMALGFYEESRNGHRIIGHGGDTQYFHSDLHLILDANVGFFVSYNSLGKDQVSPRTILFEKFMNRYFPYTPPNEPTLATAAQDARGVAGLYEISRRFETNLLSVTTLLGEAKVQVDPKDNTIFMDAFKKLNGQPKHFREIGPLLFQSVDDQSKLAFTRDETGRQVIYIDYPFMIFQRVVSPLDKTIFNYIVIGFSIGVIVLTILLWPIGAMIRKHYGKSLPLEPGAKRLRRYVHAACIVDIVFLIGLAIAVTALGKPGGLGERGDIWLHLLQVIGLVGGIGAIAAVYNSVKSWGDAAQWFWNKLWNTLLALGCAGFFWFIYHWHLLNFHLNY